MGRRRREVPDGAAWRRGSRLERDVVPSAAAARPLVEARGRAALVGCVTAALRATGPSAATGAAATTAEEADRVGDHLHARTLLPGGLVLPLVGLEPTLDVDLAPLGEVLA